MWCKTLTMILAAAAIGCGQPRAAATAPEDVPGAQEPSPGEVVVPLEEPKEDGVARPPELEEYVPPGVPDGPGEENQREVPRSDRAPLPSDEEPVAPAEDLGL